MNITILSAALVLLASAATAHDAESHASLDPDDRNWFGEQKVPEGHPNAGQSCCSQADGEFAEEDIRDGHYWVRWSKGGDKWHQVPDESVIRKPNPHGRAAVWWGGAAEGEINTIYIRCFIAGALL